ncbi:F-box/FBD/LRR-repeat protein At5g56420-like [Gastrolobium bilobum]|uniref:F-box/FBD/LRR-repeat protein At5g56420-like n=1 Tax=Gastrolobium bilobum TaxID=150636 RepID=UPI002AAFF87C|nr:F-box/FBD/LRR-repeat protein At5g56420-like [Gastrolobium bilobum]
MADRISTLPASVLCHILSFLPTKQVVATSVLNKTWNPLWRSVSTLDFHFQNLNKEKCSRFVQWVNEVILSRDLHQPIQTFRLWCQCRSFNYDPRIINMWVNVALQLRVEHLDLSLFSARIRPISLSCAILRHRTLVVLKLNVLGLKSISSIDLPSLKVLHLNKVTFLEGRYLAELLSGCPVLEDLVAKDLYFDKRCPISLSYREFKRLPKLVRADIHKRYVPLLILDNVEFLCIDKEYPRYNVIVDRYKNPNPYPRDLIPVFHNLVHFELTFFCYTMSWLHVLRLLIHCPKLQILIINQDYNFVSNYEERGWRCPPSVVPKCIPLPLKTCHLNNYKGSKGEVQFARYVMQNASILRTMKICVNAEKIGEELNKIEMLKVLSSCTRCSPTCELSFEII